MVNVEEVRVESDTMGEVKVPGTAYYGATTVRGIENFPISGLRFQKGFIESLALVKLAAAKANMQLGLLDKKKGEAIVSAAKEVMGGSLYDQFVLDVFQTGSGTMTNVNMCQSTNDVFPTAIHLSAAQAIERKLIPSLRILADVLGKKAREFEDVV